MGSLEYKWSSVVCSSDQAETRLKGYICPSVFSSCPPYLSSINTLQSTFGHFRSLTAVSLSAFSVNQSSLQLVSYTDSFQLSANAYFFPQSSLISIISDPIPDFCSISAHNLYESCYEVVQL